MGVYHAICRLVLLPSAVGVVCFSCGTANKTAIEASLDNNINSFNVEVDAAQKARSVEQGVAKLPAEEAAEDTDAQKAAAIASQAADFQEGVNLASSAYRLSQSAVSPDDWGLVASRWQRAADQLTLVSAQSEKYDSAQSKIAEYTQNAQYATERVASLHASARAPLPKRQSTDQPSSSTTPPTPVTLTRASQAGVRNSSSPPGMADIAAASAAQRSGSLAPGSVSAALDTVRVPVVRRLHGTPIVQVTFNDAKTYEMILDTGASRTLITRKMANELGIVPNDRMVAATASESQVTFDLGQMRSISIGEVRLNDAQVSIGDSIDVGLLGNDFLRGYDVTIRDREVELSRAQ